MTLQVKKLRGSEWRGRALDPVRRSRAGRRPNGGEEGLADRGTGREPNEDRGRRGAALPDRTRGAYLRAGVSRDDSKDRRPSAQPLQDPLHRRHEWREWRPEDARRPCGPGTESRPCFGDIARSSDVTGVVLPARIAGADLTFAHGARRKPSMTAMNLHNIKLLNHLDPLAEEAFVAKAVSAFARARSWGEHAAAAGPPQSALPGRPSRVPEPDRANPDETDPHAGRGRGRHLAR
jgi:hypothetical protein